MKVRTVATAVTRSNRESRPGVCRFRGENPGSGHTRCCRRRGALTYGAHIVAVGRHHTATPAVAQRAGAGGVLIRCG